MSLEQELINSLKETIKAKDDLIINLKAEIERLKIIILTPNHNSNQLTINPQVPNMNPFIAPLGPWQPYPLTQPFIVTSDTKHGSISLQGGDGTLSQNDQINTGNPNGILSSNASLLSSAS